jgi:hypothetical protein
LRHGWAAGLALGVGASLLGGACANPPLQKVPEEVKPLDDQLEIRGEVCATPPADAVFPVKILFLVDTSGSMIVTDPADVRVQAISSVIQKYEGLPGVEFGVLSFSSAIVNLTNGFTNSPNLAAISQTLSQADDLTDTQGVLGAAYELLTTDMLNSTPAERARSKYIIILFTDGVPDPLCSADTTQCGPMTCAPGSHCVPTTILAANSQQQEQYKCDPDYMICSVPKMDWASAFNPPLNPALYPNLQAGANYNTTPQILSSVDQIMALQNQYHVGSIQINTDFLFPISALSNPLAVPFDLDRPAADALLSAIATAGNGTFQEFTSDTQISFLNINYSAIQVQNSVVATFASNQNGVETGETLALDSDGDWLTDVQEGALGTCAALGPGCLNPSDTDGDGYSDFIEVTFKSSGFDPLDPAKPATPCAMPGIDSDGDGLMDCEETFLKTDPLNADTDGDFLSDLTEVRNGMNPLDPTDAYGDINKDGILNLTEIKDGLSPTAQVSYGERQFAFTYTLNPKYSADATATDSTCYQFDVQHMRLLTTGRTAIGAQGGNRIYYDVYETSADTPTNLATVRRACADVLFVNGTLKLPLSGVVDFADSDFVDITSFDPTKNCKDLTAGYKFDAGGPGLDGGTGGGG